MSTQFKDLFVLKNTHFSKGAAFIPAGGSDDIFLKSRKRRRLAEVDIVFNFILKFRPQQNFRSPLSLIMGCLFSSSSSSSTSSSPSTLLSDKKAYAEKLEEMLNVKLSKIAHFEHCVLIEKEATLALNQFQQRCTNLCEKLRKGDRSLASQTQKST